MMIDRGKIDRDVRPGSGPVYKRYSFDPSGVSPRILPGQSEAVLYACSDEHTEEGHITEAAMARKKMVEKRMRKLEGMRGDATPPECYPPDGSDVVLLGWGSSWGALREAVDLLRAEGIRATMLHFCDVHPLARAGLPGWIGENASVIGVESNYTGQFSDLFRLETGIPVTHRILKYDGRPLSPEEVARKARSLL